MDLLNPLGLVFAALGIPIIILYMLKLRRRDEPISSTLLWQHMLRDREANAPWQSLRPNLLLLLQLLILTLLTLSLARPFVPTTAIASDSAIILLDASASMQATDISPSRFDAARDVAREIVNDVSQGERVVIIIVGPHPTLLINSTNPSALHSALDRVTPTAGSADWEAAGALAQASALQAADIQTVVISDGAFDAPLPPLPGETRFVPIGQSGDNLAIAALAMREGAGGPQALLRVTNYGPAAASSTVEVYTDGYLHDVVQAEVPAHDSTTITLDDLPLDLQVLESHLQNQDPLALDNTAWAARSPAASRRVLLVTPGNLFLERALETLPGVEMTRMSPGPIPPTDEYDLVVYDGVLTETLPVGSLWLIGPPYTGHSGVMTGTEITQVAADDPILQYVDLGDVHILQAWAAEPPPGARVLIDATGGPLLYTIEQPGLRLANLTFALQDSDLPLRVAFPILTANLITWLSPQAGIGSAASAAPGDAIPVQLPPGAASAIVTTPAGSQAELALDEGANPILVVEQLGIYLVSHYDSDGTLLRRDPVTVNLFSPAESDISPNDVILVGQTELAASADEEVGERELWPWATACALVVLGSEWWVYHRGTGTPWPALKRWWKALSEQK